MFSIEVFKFVLIHGITPILPSKYLLCPLHKWQISAIVSVPQNCCQHSNPDFLPRIEDHGRTVWRKPRRVRIVNHNHSSVTVHRVCPVQSVVHFMARGLMPSCVMRRSSYRRSPDSRGFVYFFFLVGLNRRL